MLITYIYKLFSKKNTEHFYKYNICRNHSMDDFVIDYIVQNGKKEKCSFCNRIDYAIDVDTFAGFIVLPLSKFYHYFPESNSWTLRENFRNNYTIPLIESLNFSTKYILGFHLGILDSDENKGLLEVLIPKIESLCKNNYERLNKNDTCSIIEWEQFVRNVCNKRRYTFLALSSRLLNVRQDISPINNILFKVGDYLSTTKYNDILTLTTRLFRAREVKEKDKKTEYNFEDITSPPDNFARQCRMSPAGISMFYASFDKHTPIEECLKERQTHSEIIIGEFHLKKPILVIDLTNIPIPSIFSPYSLEHLFLYNFHQSITQPLLEGSNKNIEYIPSQIVTEYFRWMYKTKEGLQVHGLIYKSAKNNKRNIVLFYDQKESAEVLDLVKIETM